MQNIKIPRTEIMNDKLISHLKDDKFIDMNKIQRLFPWARFFVIKGKKNIGKTHSMLQAMEQIAKRKKKFLYLRITENEIRLTAKEWTTTASIPFNVKSRKITYIDENNNSYDAGLMAYVKNLQTLRSLQYEDYEAIFFDEFVAFNEKSYGARDSAQLELAKQFIQLIIDVQRKKDDIMVWCFGNNNIAVDLFTKTFRADKDAVINYNKEAKFVILNLKDYFKGIENSLGNALAKYIPDLEEFLADNKSMQDLSRIANYNDTNSTILQFYTALNDNIYAFLYEVEQNTRDNSPRLSGNIIITHVLERNEQIPIIALTDYDYMKWKDAIKWQYKHHYIQCCYWKDMIKSGAMKFTDNRIEQIFTNYLIGYSREKMIN